MTTLTQKGFQVVLHLLVFSSILCANTTYLKVGAESRFS